MIWSWSLGWAQVTIPRPDVALSAHLKWSEPAALSGTLWRFDLLPAWHLGERRARSVHSVKKKKTRMSSKWTNSRLNSRRIFCDSNLPEEAEKSQRSRLALWLSSTIVQFKKLLYTGVPCVPAKTYKQTKHNGHDWFKSTDNHYYSFRRHWKTEAFPFLVLSHSRENEHNTFCTYFWCADAMNAVISLFYFFTFCNCNIKYNWFCRS